MREAKKDGINGVQRKINGRGSIHLSKGVKKRSGGGERETGREIRDESGLERERVDAGQQHSKNGDDKEIKKEGEESGEASRPNGAKVKLCLAPGQNATIT